LRANLVAVSSLAQPPTWTLFPAHTPFGTRPRPRPRPRSHPHPSRRRRRPRPKGPDVCTYSLAKCSSSRLRGPHAMYHRNGRGPERSRIDVSQNRIGEAVLHSGKLATGGHATDFRRPASTRLARVLPCSRSSGANRTM